MKFLTTLLLALLAAGYALAGDDATIIETVDDYNGWGWQSIVMRNSLITVATMPQIGARIMQYDLGGHPSIFVNPAEIGAVHPPKQGTWYNYGGYKVWPAPQDVWGWPPPAILDSGEWSGEIVDDTADSVSVYVKSRTETWDKARDVGMERRTVIYKNSSRVKVEQSIINEGASSQAWSVWDVTQSIVHHQGESDYDNFWVYFPVKTEGSVFGDDGVKTSKASSAWKGEAAPGVYGVQYKPDGAKIFADSPDGWIAYVDEAHGYAYVKVFDIWEGADYPDGGARNEVWINKGAKYLEVEVLSPIWSIPPGGKITFVENWYAAKVYGPVLSVNNVGAVAAPLQRQSGTGTLSAIYGVFHRGTARIVYLNGDDEIVAEGAAHPATPLEEFDLEEELPPPAEAKTVQVRVYNETGKLLGAIESKAVDELTGVQQKDDQPQSFHLAQNYPNPFNASTTIRFSLARSQRVMLDVYDSAGRRVATLADGFMSRGEHRLAWDASKMAAGVYFVRLQGEGRGDFTKIILLK